MVPLAAPMVPPEAPRLRPRLAPSVKLAVVASVPPLMVREPGVAELGSVPRLLSAAMLSVPALMVVDAAVGVGAAEDQRTGGGLGQPARAGGDPAVGQYGAAGCADGPAGGAQAEAAVGVEREGWPWSPVCRR